MSEGIKAKEETPEGKRCCFCFPLQYGLITWGYFKMIVSASFILVISYALLHTCMTMEYNGDNNRWFRIYADIVITSIALTLFLADLLLTMLLIVAAPQKRLKLLRGFYIFSVVMWAVTILLSAMTVSLSIESWLSRYASPRSFVINLLNFSAYFVIIIVQTYFLLLLRGEIIRLRRNGEFKFTNNEAGAKCTMKCEEKKGEDTDDTEESSE